MKVQNLKGILAEHENMFLNAIIALEIAIVLWMSIVAYFGSISDFREYVSWRIETIPRTCLMETGITRSEMLVRFGPADLMEIYYDKEKYKMEVTKYYYRIDEDYDLFLMFVYSWTTGKIIDFDMVRGYQRWCF